MTTAGASPNDRPDLRAIVERYSVRWAVYPEWAPDENWVQRKVGFVIELTGTHVDPPHPIEPGCPSCQDVYRNLGKVAEWIMPTEHRPSAYEVDPFLPKLSYASKRPSVPEVRLDIRIFHREHYRDPVDACEQRCLAEMKHRLELLGVRHE